MTEAELWPWKSLTIRLRIEHSCRSNFTGRSSIKKINAILIKFYCHSAELCIVFPHSPKVFADDKLRNESRRAEV